MVKNLQVLQFVGKNQRDLYTSFTKLLLSTERRAMISSEWLDWMAVFCYITITVFVMYRVFMTNNN